MVCQLVEPEVTMTEVICQHLAMGLKIIDRFSADQRKELKKYSKLARSKKAKGGGGFESEDSSEQSNQPTTIPFKTISFLHKTLVDYFDNACNDQTQRDDEAPCHYLHEVLRGSTVHIPELPKPERNPELEARCQRLRLDQQEKAYQEMVTNVSGSTLSTTADLASEFSKAAQSTSSALIVVANIFLTVVAAFFFGFFASKYVMPAPNLAAETLVGVVMATVVAAADLYFLIRSGI